MAPCSPCSRLTPPNSGTGLGNAAHAMLESGGLDADAGAWPALAPGDTTLVEGFADLAYREGDGAQVIVDFNADVGVSQATLEVYWARLSI
ncbi:MAG: hypothetical protein SW127_20570 [Actinomycetota bacterium]|nr:hypothetical protein [Actinomycetota bacterium]